MQRHAEDCLLLHHTNVFPAAQAAKQAAADELRAMAEAHAAQAAEAAAEAVRALTAVTDAHVCELAKLHDSARASAEAALVRATETCLQGPWAGLLGVHMTPSSICTLHAASLYCMHADGLPRAYLLACHDCTQQKQALQCGQVREREAEQAYAGLEARLAALQRRFEARESRAEDLAQIAEAQADASRTRAELAALQARMAQQASRTQQTGTVLYQHGLWTHLLKLFHYGQGA